MKFTNRIEIMNVGVKVEIEQGIEQGMRKT